MNGGKPIDWEIVFLIPRILNKLKYSNKAITFNNALEIAKEQNRIYPARLAAMVIVNHRGGPWGWEDDSFTYGPDW